MHFNWSILIWIAAVLFVYVFGLFEGRGQGYKKRRAEEAEEKRNEPEKEPKPAPAVVTTVKVDDPGLLRIKNDDGYLTLDLDGSRVDTAALTNDQRKRLIEMLNLIRPWLEGKPTAAPVPTPPPAPVSTPLQPTSTPVIATPPVPQPAHPPSTPRPSTIAKEDRPVAPAGSIVSQIDSILQMRIAGSPLEDRGVFLAQSPEGGVIVYVGMTKYMGVDNVPDPDVKAAIRAAITEWEDKYTPGI